MTCLDSILCDSILCDAQQLLQWKLEVIEDVSTSFLEQLRQLIETVRQMETALQRRSKLRTTTGGGAASASGVALTDSEKISLQIRLDVEGECDDHNSHCDRNRDQNLTCYDCLYHPSLLTITIPLILSCPVVTAYGVEIMQLLGPSSSSDCLARLSCYNALKELIATEVVNT